MEVLYLPAGSLPSVSQCLSASGGVSSQLSLLPDTQNPSPSQAAALLSRARSNYSLISRHGVDRMQQHEEEAVAAAGDTAAGGDSGGGGAQAASGSPTPLLHILLPFFNANMRRLLSYPAANAQSPAVGPVLLLSNAVPFVPGLRVGVSEVSLYVGVNLPLQKGDSAVLQALERDCKQQKRVVLQLRVPSVSSATMFFTMTGQPFSFLFFPVPCEYQQVPAAEWPPPTPESFVQQVRDFNLEAATLFKEDVPYRQ